ncbi:MAG: phosphoribosyltransferase [Gammaproteobacteria bacterium]|nr:phosphoribosyltransferase [Gammaproteobacteria bacterium]
MDRYYDRCEAGKILAKQLSEYRNRKDVIVLALPRGGVPVAYEIAKALSVPLDIFIVRKLGVPGHEELAMGAIAMGGVTFFNQDLLDEIVIPKSDIERVVQSEKKELERREKKYRGNKAFPELKNKTIILVDDGIATGATIRVAVKALRKYHPISIIIAVPVVATSVYAEIAKSVEKIVCPLIPEYLYAVGTWYETFPQISDEEVFEFIK